MKIFNSDKLVNEGLDLKFNVKESLFARICIIFCLIMFLCLCVLQCYAFYLYNPEIFIEQKNEYDFDYENYDYRIIFNNDSLNDYGCYYIYDIESLDNGCCKINYGYDVMNYILGTTIVEKSIRRIIIIPKDQFAIQIFKKEV